MIIKLDLLNKSFTDRLRAVGIHLVVSMILAALAALLVFLVWYPYPYREISGGRELFLIIVAVDVVMGPLLTLTIFNTTKPHKELRRDILVIGLFQLAALGYGLWTVAISRPVHLIFEIDRFRVVHAIDIPDGFINQAPPALRKLPLTGPTLLSVREFKDSKESFDATLAALQGDEIGMRPEFWQPYSAAKTQVLMLAKPLAELKARFPASRKEIDGVLRDAGRVPIFVGYVPLVSRQNLFWTVLIDLKTAEVLAFVPIDSF